MRYSSVTWKIWSSEILLFRVRWGQSVFNKWPYYFSLLRQDTVEDSTQGTVDYRLSGLSLGASTITSPMTRPVITNPLWQLFWPCISSTHQCNLMCFLSNSPGPGPTGYSQFVSSPLCSVFPSQVIHLPYQSSSFLFLTDSHQCRNRGQPQSLPYLVPTSGFSTLLWV